MHVPRTIAQALPEAQLIKMLGNNLERRDRIGRKRLCESAEEGNVPPPHRACEGPTAQAEGIQLGPGAVGKNVGGEKLEGEKGYWVVHLLFKKKKKKKKGITRPRSPG
jgi:hypothetical protein